MAHLATMIEAVDLGRRNDTTFSKDDRHQRLLSDADRDGALSARTDPGAGAHAWPDGQASRALVGPLDTAAELYNWWVDRGYDWLAMSEDLPRDDNRVTLDGTGRIVLRYRPTNVRAHRQLVAEMKRILARLGLRLSGHALARHQQHDAPVRHRVLRHRPAHLSARPVLPDARRAQSLRRRRVVLSVVGCRQPGPHDCRAGAARGRPHHGEAAVNPNAR